MFVFRQQSWNHKPESTITGCKSCRGGYWHVLWLLRLAFLRWEATQPPVQNTRTTLKRVLGPLPRPSLPSLGEIEHDLKNKQTWLSHYSLHNKCSVYYISRLHNETFLDMCNNTCNIKTNLLTLSHIILSIVHQIQNQWRVEIIHWLFTWFLSHSPVPNRYTFTCPYCNCQNLDQDGLVEHCTSQHARDTRQVVRRNLLCDSTSCEITHNFWM